MVDLIQYFLSSCDPQLGQTWFGFRAYGLRCWLHWTTFRVEWSTCSVLSGLLECSRAVSCAGPLETQKVNALLPIKWLFHRIFALLLTRGRNRLALLQLHITLCLSLLIESLLDSRDWILGFHQLADKEAFLVLFDRLEGCSHGLLEVRFSGTGPLRRFRQCFGQCDSLFYL